MHPKLFKKSEGITRRISDTFSVDNYLTSANSDQVSVAVGKAENHTETTENSSDRVYFVLEGQISVNDNLVGEEGDVIYIPAKTTYGFKGTFKVIIINSPPFKKSSEKIQKISGIKE